MRAIVRAAFRLEPQLATHADEMFAVLSDPAIYEFENQPPASLEALRHRFTLLESRGSPDGSEQWFNWVLRLDDGRAAGYLQATLYAGARADIAYELASAFWGRGLAARAVQVMIDELAMHHDVRYLSAMLKRANHRSLRLLRRLGFVDASPAEHRRRDIAPDERLLERACGAGALCVRECLPDDLPAALALWRVSPGVGLSDADEPAALQRFLARNPGLSAVATRGTTLVGTVLCGHDGRRGLIHHLVVAEAERRRGIARALVERASSALHRAAIGKCHLMAFADNAAAHAFWHQVGARRRDELTLWSITTASTALDD
jgi:ribosomal-protein-alanine N-acetyltransferase